jgi:hypothetical protein
MPYTYVKKELSMLYAYAKQELYMLYGSRADIMT